MNDHMAETTLEHALFNFVICGLVRSPLSPDLESKLRNLNPADLSFGAHGQFFLPPQVTWIGQKMKTVYCSSLGSPNLMKTLPMLRRYLLQDWRSHLAWIKSGCGGMPVSCVLTGTSRN